MSFCHFLTRRLPTLNTSDVASIEISFTEIKMTQLDRQTIRCKNYEKGSDFIECGRAASWRLFKKQPVNCVIPGLEEINPGWFSIPKI